MKEDKGTLQDGPRVNEEITSPEVRLVDENGEMVGVVSQKQALERAYAAGLDLVEVSPNADPPVCKILNHGKFKYEEQKRRAEIRKKQKIIEIKEIQLRPGIDKHDFEVKMRSARKFIEEGDKLKVTLRFRGREVSHQEFGMEVLNRVKDALQDIAKVEQFPKLEGKRVIMVMGPAK
ncbi:MAG: translation initiation factor IF-3 [Alphaproteobacteria bacterium 41-28]|nr:MAG: translation initiation factor IF-3 [Alphaproteobacteria bacterium 41-28]